MIVFSCPTCQKKLSVKDDSVGKKAKCPGCGQFVIVPSMAAVPPQHSQLEIRGSKIFEAPLRHRPIATGGAVDFQAADGTGRVKPPPIGSESETEFAARPGPKHESTRDATPVLSGPDAETKDAILAAGPGPDAETQNALPAARPGPMTIRPGTRHTPWTLAGKTRPRASRLRPDWTRNCGISWPAGNAG